MHMKEELQTELFKKYPEIFKEKDLPMSKTCMCWGIACDDGWYKIIENVCSKLQAIKNLVGLQVIAKQVKEKYGGLCFYYGCEGNSKDIDKQWIEIVDNIVSQAENKSYTICEICGDFGELCVKGLWYKTLCTEHEKINGYEKSNKEE